MTRGSKVAGASSASSSRGGRVEKAGQAEDASSDAPERLRVSLGVAPSVSEATPSPPPASLPPATPPPPPGGSGSGLSSSRLPCRRRARITRRMWSTLTRTPVFEATSSVISFGGIRPASPSMIAFASSVSLPGGGGGRRGGRSPASPSAAIRRARLRTVFRCTPNASAISMSVAASICESIAMAASLPTLSASVEDLDEHAPGEDRHLALEAVHHQLRPDGDPLGRGEGEEEGLAAIVLGHDLTLQFGWAKVKDICLGNLLAISSPISP